GARQAPCTRDGRRDGRARERCRGPSRRRRGARRVPGRSGPGAAGRGHSAHRHTSAFGTYTHWRKPLTQRRVKLIPAMIGSARARAAFLSDPSALRAPGLIALVALLIAV